MERQEEIRAIAYSIWENEGCPEGRHLDHWLNAEAIWRERIGRERSVRRTESRVKRVGRRPSTRSVVKSIKQNNDTTCL